MGVTETKPEIDTQYSPIRAFKPSHDYLQFTQTEVETETEKQSSKKATIRDTKYNIKIDELQIGPIIGSGSSGLSLPFVN